MPREWPLLAASSLVSLHSESGYMDTLGCFSASCWNYSAAVCHCMHTASYDVVITLIWILLYFCLHKAT